MSKPEMELPVIEMGGRTETSLTNMARSLQMQLPRASPGRLIIGLRTEVGFIGGHEKPAVLDKSLPEAVRAKGISAEVWKTWIDKLDEAIKANRYSTATVLLFTSLCITCPCMFYRLNDIQRAVGKWMKEFNEEVMVGAGMYCKTQTATLSAQEYREDISWLAIATTPEEVEKLQNESHVFWYTADFHNPHKAKPMRASPGQTNCCVLQVV